LDAIELLNASLPTQPEKLPHPQTLAAAKKQKAIQELKKEGRSQAEVREIFGTAKINSRAALHRNNSKRYSSFIAG